MTCRTGASALVRLFSDEVHADFEFGLPGNVQANLRPSSIASSNASDADNARHLESGPGRGEIADCALKGRESAIDHDTTTLENALPGRGAMFLGHGEPSH